MSFKERPSFPLAEALVCADCKVVFSCRDLGCPKCGGSPLAAVRVDTDAAAKAISRLKEELFLAEAAFLQIARGLHDSEFKKRMAEKAIAAIRKNRPTSIVALTNTVAN